MEDFIFGIFGLLICMSPFALLGGLIYLVNRSAKPSGGPKQDQLEWQLAALRAEHDALNARVGLLEEQIREGAVVTQAALASPVTSSLESSEPTAQAEEVSAQNLGPPTARELVERVEALSEVSASSYVAEARAGGAPQGASVESAQGASVESAQGASAKSAQGASAESAQGASSERGVSLASASAADATGRAASLEAAVASASVVASPATADSPASVSAALDPSAASGALPPAPPQGGSGATPPEGGGLEQLVGVKGAAVLGALVLVIAGLYFFQYSIEHGLLGPELRVALGFVVGMACVVLSERPLRALAPVLSPWMAGAGIAILYAASWASSALYHLLPVWGAGGLMVVVTAVAALLAVRRESLPIAVLGLLGGFITPIALSTGEDHPIPLFAYLLVLDGAILAVAHYRRWPSLGLLAMIATAVYQLGWLGGRMGEGTALIGLAIVMVFTALFAFVPLPASGDEGDKTLPLATRVGATLLPFLFVLTFVFRAGVAVHAWPTVALVLTAAVGVLFVARRESMSWLVVVGSVSASGVSALFALRWWSGESEFWPLVVLLSALPLLFHLNAERTRMQDADARNAAAIPVLTIMATLVLCAAAHHHEPFLYLALTFLALLLGLRQASLRPRAFFAIVLALLSAIAAFIALLMYPQPEGMPSTSLLLGLQVVSPVLFTIATLLARAERGGAAGETTDARPEPARPEPSARPSLDVATLVAGCATLALLALRVEFIAPRESVLVALTIGSVFLLALLPTARTAPVTLALPALVSAAFAATQFSFAFFRTADASAMDVRLPLLCFVVLASTAWPFMARRVGASPWGWRTAALAGPLLMWSFRQVWLELFGADAIGALPVALGALVLLTAIGARRRTANDPETQRTATVWLAAVAAAFVTLAIPLQLSNEWLTIGWVLEATALLALDSRLRHTGLRYLAIALYACALIRLSPIPYLLEYHPRGTWRLVNWLSYTYLVPAASLLAGALLLRRYEHEVRNDWEKGILGGLSSRPVYAGFLFSGVIGLVFVWLNLSIIDFYATGPYLVIPTDLLPARELTISAAWALYALLLLGLGMRGSSTALRSVSLLLMLATCAKVFLYDLSNLGDLYRVGALVFLAFSLIAVSFFYQRFVFKRQGT